MTVKIAFDVGGVISKYPTEFFVLIETLFQGTRRIREKGGTGGVEVHIISDIHPKDKIWNMLLRNGHAISYQNVHSADYKTHGEACKAVLCRELGIDVLVDDFIGYVAIPDAPPVRLLLMPDPNKPYYEDAWKTDGSEGDFGRRNPPGSKRPPEDRLPVEREKRPASDAK